MQFYQGRPEYRKVSTLDIAEEHIAQAKGNLQNCGHRKRFWEKRMKMDNARTFASYCEKKVMKKDITVKKRVM